MFSFLEKEMIMIHARLAIILLLGFVVGCSNSGGSGGGTNSSGDVITSNQQPAALDYQIRTYVYLVNRDKNNVSRCVMDPGNGDLAECISTGNGLNDPIGISVNNDFAYIANNKKWRVLLVQLVFVKLIKQMQL